MIAGRGRHRLGDESVELTPGMAIRIPQKGAPQSGKHRPGNDPLPGQFLVRKPQNGTRALASLAAFRLESTKGPNPQRVRIHKGSESTKGRTPFRIGSQSSERAFSRSITGPKARPMADESDSESVSAGDPPAMPMPLPIPP